MKCQTCGHELGEGRVFCSRCGSELQMVPDYNLIEDELVVPFVEDKKGHAKGKHEASDDKNVSKLQITKKQLLIIVLVVLIVILAITSVLDDLVFTPLIHKWYTKYQASVVIDERQANEDPQE